MTYERGHIDGFLVPRHRRAAFHKYGHLPRQVYRHRQPRKPLTRAHRSPASQSGTRLPFSFAKYIASGRETTFLFDMTPLFIMYAARAAR